MNTDVKGVKQYNFIRNNMSTEAQEVLPVGNADNISSISAVLTNQNYKSTYNEFINVLVNRIGLTIIENKMTYNNPLAIFKKGSVPLGTDIQSLYENPAKEYKYEVSHKQMARLLHIEDPDTHVAYYSMNRKGFYQKSISRENVAQAFTSWEAFEEFITQITNSLYSGNYIDEFEYTKLLIDGAYDNNKIITEHVDKVTDDASAKAFVKKAQTLYELMQFPSTKYNAYTKFDGSHGEVKTWTNEDRICIILPAEVKVNVNIELLAKAFNMEVAKLKGRIVTIDHFENEAIQGVICDESFLQIYDNLLEFEDFRNGAALITNIYLHSWNTFAISPFANAICLTTEDTIPATKISTNESVSVEVGKESDITIAIEPENATSDISVYNSNPSVFEVAQTDVANKLKIMGIAEGNANLFLKTDNGLTFNVDVSVIPTITE